MVDHIRNEAAIVERVGALSCASLLKKFYSPLALGLILSDTDAKANMTKRLYVGGLPYDVTDDVLENLFSAYGTVESATLIIDKITDLPQGFGFVEMSCESEAQEAIQNLNGTQVEGRTIKVHEVRSRPVLPRRKSTRRHRW